MQVLRVSVVFVSLNGRTETARMVFGADPMRSGALLLDSLSDLRFHKWAFPVALVLFALQIVISQAEPIKYALQSRGPESVCDWNQYYMPLMPLPWCPPARS